MNGVAAKDLVPGRRYYIQDPIGITKGSGEITGIFQYYHPSDFPGSFGTVHFTELEDVSELPSGLGTLKENDYSENFSFFETQDEAIRNRVGQVASEKEEDAEVALANPNRFDEITELPQRIVRSKPIDHFSKKTIEKTRGPIKQRIGQTYNPNEWSYNPNAWPFNKGGKTRRSKKGRKSKRSRKSRKTRKGRKSRK